MSSTDIFGLGGCGLLYVALVAVSFPLHRLSAGVRYAVMLGVAVAVFIPIGGPSLVGITRGATGDLSVPTLILAASACVSRIAGRTMFAPRELSALLRAVAAAALFLYPFALGWTPFDSYALGYGSIAMVTTLLLVTLAAWRASLKLVVIVVLAGSLAYLAGLYESRNLWDYLIDPLSAFYAVARISAGGLRRYWPSAASARP